MKKIYMVLAVVLLMGIAGCGSSDSGKLSSAKAMTAFSLNGVSGVISGASAMASMPNGVSATIDETAKTIAVTMPYGTDVTDLVATFTTTGDSVKVGETVQVSGTTANDFTDPVVYTVTAADSSTQDYTVTVTVAASSAKAITAYALNGTAGTINETAKTISVTMPYGTAVTNLVATFTTTGASVKVGATVQVSGTTANDFTDPVVYTVTAADATTQDYTVTVTVEPASNSAPTGPALSDVTLSDVNMGNTYTLDTSSGVTDANGDTLTYSASGLPSWLSIDAGTGVLSGTIPDVDVGGEISNITVTVSDGKGGTLDRSFTLTVNNDM